MLRRWFFGAKVEIFFFGRVKHTTSNAKVKVGGLTVGGGGAIEGGGGGGGRGGGLIVISTLKGG